MKETTCPGCGESEALRGRSQGEDIVVTCERCGTEWIRGAPRCKQCGRADGIELSQQMTRHPRGTLLSIVGQRRVMLCRDCDHEVVATAVEHRRPIPEGYVSRFHFGESAPPPTAPARPSPDAGDAASPTAPKRRPTTPSTAPVQQPRTDPAPTAPSDPTLRQATEEFLTATGTVADSLTMLLLGGRLGPTTRLSRLDDDNTAADLRAWLTETFGAHTDQHDQAVDAVRRALTFWREQGWLTRDLAPQL